MNKSVLFEYKFRPKMLRKTIQIQRRPLAGQFAAKLAKKRNPGLSRLKEKYRRKYLELKRREQRMYGSRGAILAKRY
jgi:hypothetical protein